jgi:hypothetical protein
MTKQGGAESSSLWGKNFLHSARRQKRNRFLGLYPILCPPPILTKCY